MIQKPLDKKIQDLNLNTSPSEVDEVIQKIQDLSDNPNLFSRNRSAHEMLLGSVKITRVTNNEEQTAIIKLIDFNQPTNNDFEVIAQLSIQGAYEKRRPDLVVYLNGLPLVVIELKNPADEHATLENAYNQIQTYQSQIDDLFTFNLVNVLSDGAYTGVGSITKVWRILAHARIGQIHIYGVLCR